MLIGGIQKTSLIDYPEKISSVVFTIGCNFRCGYCHNMELIKLNNESNIFDEGEFFNFLKKRIGKIDAIVITGGEPTLQNDLFDFIKKIKDMNYLTKLDTNGTNPDIIEKLLNENLLNYIAMDIKAPFEKYNKITKSFVDIKNIKKSVEIIMKSKIDYEFRTTVLKNQLTFDDFEKIGQEIKGSKNYYLQKFVSSKILDSSLEKETTYSDFEFNKIINILKKYLPNIYLR